jgi:3-isopropylmalate dehydrogenase
MGRVPYEVRPEAGLLRLRKDMELFANLRPAICYRRWPTPPR